MWLENVSGGRPCMHGQQPNPVLSNLILLYDHRTVGSIRLHRILDIKHVPTLVLINIVDCGISHLYVQAYWGEASGNFWCGMLPSIQESSGGIWRRGHPPLWEIPTLQAADSMDQGHHWRHIFHMYATLLQEVLWGVSCWCMKYIQWDEMWVYFGAVSHLCYSSDLFTFNYYHHHTQFMVVLIYGTVETNLRCKGVTQGYPFFIVAYGLVVSTIIYQLQYFPQIYIRSVMQMILPVTDVSPASIYSRNKYLLRGLK